MMKKLCDAADRFRVNHFDSDDSFRRRWSPRAMTGEALPVDVLFALFEAAHWAPSSGNSQPWRFLYAQRDDLWWDRFLGLVTEKNQRWCRTAAALLVVISKTIRDDGKSSPTHAFSTGAAWGLLALEGARRGLVVHAMAGFDYARARTELSIPDEFEVQIMAAIGLMADKTVLPPDLAEREKPSGRKELIELTAHGGFVREIW